MKISIPFLIIFQLINLSIFQSFSQIGGNNTYGFLDMVTSARIASLGGNAISLKDDDLNIAFQNPSLLDSTMHDHLSLSYVDYFSDINYGTVIYSKTYEKYGSFSAGAHYVHYGTFQGADATGNLLNKFSAADYALILGWGRNIDSSFTVGGNFKMIFSKLESYFSFGLAIDLACTYHNANRDFTATAIIKNTGFQLKAYYPKNREPLPFEIQLGVSKRIKHAPFRVLLVAHSLQKLDLTYKDPNETVQNIDPLTGETIKQKKKIGDKIMRHFIFGGEFLVSKNFNIRFGYNYQRRKELQVATKRAMTGFSWGFGFRISKFHISYGRASYHLVGGPNYFTITTNLSEFYSK